MKTTTVLAAVVAATAPAIADEASPKVVNFQNLALKPMQRTSKHNPEFVNHAAVQAQLVNQQNLYAINLTIGTPGQSLGVQIDTGSSDLWVPVANSRLCATRSAQCDLYGTFDPTNSNTLRASSQAFSITYGDGTNIKGTFVKDTVSFSGASVTQAQFAVATAGDSNTNINGILGVGYETNEATADSTSGSTYTNFVASMKQQGLINTMAYSMWLNDLDSADGNVLFGGVDTDKFNTPLISMPVVPDSGGGYTTLSLPMTGLSFSSDGQSFTYTPSNFASPALIDSGTTLMYLPDDIVSAIFKSLGARVQSTGDAYMPCNSGTDPTAKLTFEFNGKDGAKIDIALNDLLFAGTTNDKSLCELLISGGAPDGLIILGDSFMRSAYLVYDLENNMIGVAQTKFNVTSSNIKEISGSSIPSASVMSTLVSGLAVNGAAATEIPQGTDPFSSGSGSSGALQTTSSAPTFAFTQTTAAGAQGTGGSGGRSGGTSAAGPARQAPVVAMLGVFAGTITLLGVFGGAMIMWL